MCVCVGYACFAWDACPRVCLCGRAHVCLRASVHVRGHHGDSVRIAFFCYRSPLCLRVHVPFLFFSRHSRAWLNSCSQHMLSLLWSPLCLCIRVPLFCVCRHSRAWFSRSMFRCLCRGFVLIGKVCSRASVHVRGHHSDRSVLRQNSSFSPNLICPKG